MYRKINKDSATQVNADKIGVQIKGDVQVTTSIKVDYSFNAVRISSTNPTVSGVSSYTLLVNGNKLGVYVSDETLTDGGVTYYKVNALDDSYLAYLFPTKTPSVGDKCYMDGTIFGRSIEVIDNSSVLNEFGDGVFINEDGTHYTSTDYPNKTFTKLIDSSNKVLMIDSDDIFYGYVTIDTEVTMSDTMFDENGTEGGLTKWTSTDMETLYGVRNIYTEGDTPSEGDSVIFNPSVTDYNPQTVKEVVVIEEELPVEPNCTVSYSVDGETWTEHPTALTDMNNVINNIPRYMYLKFSQDVIITEE